MINLQTKLEMASMFLLQQLKINAPKKTWNLTDNAIRLVQIAPKHWQIIIGGEVAPYGVYTNEKHNIAHGVYEGRENYHWVENTIDECMPYIRSIMGGEISLDDITTNLEASDTEIDNLRQLQINGGNVYEADK